MIKCFFVDVKSISSDLPRSTFAESDLEGLANLILETDGLLRPIIIKQVGLEQYTVIEGHREYYAAVKAKEQDSKKAEMVNAFVINQKNEQSAIDQLKLLVGDPPSIGAENKSIDRERDHPNDLSLSAISSLISEKLQPLYQELVEQKRMLAAMTERSIIDRLADRQTILEHITKTSESIGSKLSEGKSPKPKKTDPALAKMLASIEPAKLSNSLHLINTLSQPELSLRMKRSAISKSETLATNIVDARSMREDSKFDSWESVVSSVSGLGVKNTPAIIETFG
jgi:ParB-like nuclease domain